MDYHSILLFCHIVLMSYWLGGDLGVYLAANRVADPALSLEERLRFLHLAMKLDMAPRTALILMLPLGTTLACNLGLLDVTNTELMIFWTASFCWLGLTWAVFIKQEQKIGNLLRQIDLFIRYGLLLILLSFVMYGHFIRPKPIEYWLNMKILVFTCIIFLGLMLRIQVSKWAIGFKMLREKDNIEKAEEIIISTRKTASKQAILLWSLLLVSGFLGTTKLF